MIVDNDRNLFPCFVVETSSDDDEGMTAKNRIAEANHRRSTAQAGRGPQAASDRAQAHRSRMRSSRALSSFHSLSVPPWPHESIEIREIIRGAGQVLLYLSGLS